MPTPPLSADDWRRIRDALRYTARDLHQRSYAVTANRRELLWQEMDHCLALADRIEADLDAGPGFNTEGRATESALAG